MKYPSNQRRSLPGHPQLSSLFDPDVIPLFRGLGTSDLDYLQTVAVPEQLSAHSYLVRMNSYNMCVYVLLSGTVRISIKRPAKPQVTLNLLGPGEVLGEMSALDGLPPSANVLTTEESRVLCFSQDVFRDCVEKMPMLSKNLMSILTRRLRRSANHIESLATLNVSGRVVQQLLSFSEDYGQVTPTGTTLIPLRLPNSELAGLVGATREHVSRAMSTLKSADHLSTSTGYRILLHDIATLRQLCT